MDDTIRTVISVILTIGDAAVGHDPNEGVPRALRNLFVGLNDDSLAALLHFLRNYMGDPEMLDPGIARVYRLVIHTLRTEMNLRTSLRDMGGH